MSGSIRCRVAFKVLLAGLGLSAASSCATVEPVERQPASVIASDAATIALEAVDGDVLRVASFNIQFLGSFLHRENEPLAELMKPFDVVIVQELVAAPYPGTYPDGAIFDGDTESAAFFDEMEERGFVYALSEEDTGTGASIHSEGTDTEWFVTFYRPDRVEVADDLYTGFLANDRSNHPDYERVPYALALRAGSEDLVFVSVHLQPDSGTVARARRAHELASIASWIDEQDGPERDYVIVGDMNIQNCTELASAMPAGFISLNGGCVATNTNVNGPRPYDHVMLRLEDTGSEIPGEMAVIDLIEAMRSSWDPEGGAYPGDPYDHNAFRQAYSDHHPVAFEIVLDGVDDD